MPYGLSQLDPINPGYETRSTPWGVNINNSKHAGQWNGYSNPWQVRTSGDGPEQEGGGDYKYKQGDVAGPLGFVSKVVGENEKRLAAEEKAKADAEEEDAKKSDADTQAQIQKFIKATMTLDPNDPYAQQVAQSAQNMSSQQSEAQGLGRAGMSSYASDLATKSALGGYQNQRQQMGMQGLGMLQQQRGMQRNFGEGRRQFNLGFQNQLDMQANGLDQQAYESSQGQRQGIGGLIGGAVGALGFLGGPALGAATMAAGAGLGAGVGGMTGGGYHPRRPSGRGYGGGGGYRNY